MQQGSHSDWKTWKMGRYLQLVNSVGILNRLETLRKKSHKILANSGNLKKREFLFLVIFR